MIKVLLVDDQSVMRQAVGTWLGIEPDMKIVGEAESGEVALTLVPELQPDVVLMDIDMPTIDGIATAAQLHLSTPQSAVVMLSMHDDPTVQERAKAAGAAAFVSKHQALDKLVDVIRQVVRANPTNAQSAAAPA